MLCSKEPTVTPLSPVTIPFLPKQKFLLSYLLYSFSVKFVLLPIHLNLLPVLLVLNPKALILLLILSIWMHCKLSSGPNSNLSFQGTSKWPIYLLSQNFSLL